MPSRKLSSLSLFYFVITRIVRSAFVVALLLVLLVVVLLVVPGSIDGYGNDANPVTNIVVDKIRPNLKLLINMVLSDSE